MNERACADLRSVLDDGRLTVKEVVEEVLARVPAIQRSTNAFAHVDADGARLTAAALDQLAPQERGPLHGVPVTIKDLFVVDGMPTRAGTRAALPPLGGQSVLVTRLRAAGAVVIGKTNMHEVALGLTGDNPWTGAGPQPPRPRTYGRRQLQRLRSRTLAAGAGLASLGADTAGSTAPAGKLLRSCRVQANTRAAVPCRGPCRCPRTWITPGRWRITSLTFSCC